MFQRVALSAGCAAVMAWATNAVVANNALASMNTIQFLALEFAAASVILAVVTAIPGRVIAAGGDRGRMVPAAAIRLRPAPFVLGVVGSVGTVTLQALAFTHAPVIQANLLAYSWPLLVGLWFVTTTRLPRPWLYLAVVATGLFGVWLMLGRADADAPYSAWGYLFAAGSALCMACYTIAAGRARLSISHSLLPAVVSGAVLFLAVTFVASAAWPSWSELLRPIYLGCVPMAAGYALWTYANARGHPAWVATLGYLTPALSTILLVVTDSRLVLTNRELVGIGLVLLCTATTGYLVHRARPRSR